MFWKISKTYSTQLKEFNVDFIINLDIIIFNSLIFFKLLKEKFWFRNNIIIFIRL